MIKPSIIRYFFIAITFLGSFSTYPKAVPAANADEPEESNVIEISTAQDFQNINNDLTAHYVIINDIDFEGFNLSPIAAEEHFTGILDGQDFILSNLIIVLPEVFDMSFFATGLFIHNAGIIKNIHIESIGYSRNVIKTTVTNDASTNMYILSTFIVYNHNQGFLLDSSIHLLDITLSWDVVLESPQIIHDYSLDVFLSHLVYENDGQLSNVKLSLLNRFHVDFQNGNRNLILIVASVIFNRGLLSKLIIQFGFLSPIDRLLQTLRINYREIGPNFASIIYAYVNYQNNGIIENSIVSSKKQMSFDIHHSALFLFAGISIENYGTINNNFFHIEETISIDNAIILISNPSFNFNYSGLVYSNKSTGIISNNYVSYALETNFNFRRLNNFVFNWAGLVYENLGQILFSYNYGFNNFVYTSLNFQTFESTISRLTSLNDSSSSIENSASSLDLIVYVKSFSTIRVSAIKTNTTFFNTVGNYSENNKINVATDKFDLDFGYFVSSNGPLTKLYRGDIYIFQQNITYKIFTNLDTIEGLLLTWFKTYFSETDVWSFDQLSMGDGPVLNDLTLIPFDLKNNELYPIGFTYQVPETNLYTRDGLLLEPGNYFFTDLGTFTFTLRDTLNLFENYLQVLSVNDDINIKDGDTYFEKVTPKIQGGVEMTLNGEPFVSGTEINSPGQHTLIIFGLNDYQQVIRFSITLSFFDSIINGQTSTGSLTPTFSGGNATLNNQPFESGTTVTAVGNYVLVINGVNDFSETLKFTIIPHQSGINNGTFDPGFIPSIEGDIQSLTLNGVSYTRGTPITTPGEHALTILGVNGYELPLSFTIKLKVLDDSLTKNYDYIFPNPVIPKFSGGLATLNNEPFVFGTVISEVGNYTLIITGVNGIIIDTYNFRIIEGINSFIPGSSSFTFNILGGTNYKLNNNTYVSGTPITTPGDYSLTIEGVNNYKSTYPFKIELEVNSLINEGIYFNSIRPTFSGGTFTLNDDVYFSGQEIVNVGDYVLVVLGLEDQPYRTYNFSIRPTIENLSNNGRYTNSVTPEIFAPGATLTLNGLPYTINTIISNPGVNKLVIYGTNNQQTVLDFTIVPLIETPINEKVIINTSVDLSWSGGIATLNGVELSGLSYTVDTIGTYTFIVLGIGNNYNFTRTFSILPFIDNLESNSSYLGSILPTIEAINGTILLNNLPYNNQLINSPGVHEIKILGANNYQIIIPFTIELVLTGVINESTYTNQQMTIVYSGGIATLNDLPFESGTIVKEIGHYRLLILGTNGFEETINFTIQPRISGLSIGTTYRGSNNPIIVGEGMSITLNGQPYISGSINMPGEHILVIESPHGDYQQVITFTIDLVVIGVSKDRTYSNFVIPVFSGGNLQLNNLPFSNGTRIETYGDFILTVSGVSDFSETFVFTIVPYLASIPNNESVHTTFNFNISALHPLTKVTLNGEDKPPSANQLDAIGHYTLEIQFNEVVILESFFTIEPDDYLLSGSLIDTPFTLHYPHAEVLINDKTMTGVYRFDQQGTYVIEIKGVGEYYHTFTIEFINPNIDRTLLLLLPLAISMSLPLLAYGLRRRKVV